MKLVPQHKGHKGLSDGLKSVLKKREGSFEAPLNIHELILYEKIVAEFASRASGDLGRFATKLYVDPLV